MADIDTTYLDADMDSIKAARPAILEAVQRINQVTSSTGAAYISGGGQVVSSITALKALLKTSASTKAFVTGYYASGDGGGGDYYYDSADTTSVDNGGTIIVATDGGRWKLNNTGYISVKQFGVKGDGVTDDTTRLQAAVNYAYSVNGSLLIPDNCNILSGAITVTMSGAANKALRIMGSSVIGSMITAKSGLTATSLLKFTSSNPATTLIECQLHLEDFSLYGYGTPVSGVHGLSLAGLADFVISNVRITGFDRGHDISSCLIGVINDDSQCVGNLYGSYIRLSGTVNTTNLIRYENCKLNLNTKIGIDYNGGSQLQLRGNNIEGNGTAADLTTGGVFIRGALAPDSLVAGILLDGNWLESNKGYGVYVEAPTGGVVTNIAIKGGNIIAQENGKAIKVLGASRLMIDDLACVSPSDVWDITADKAHLRNALVTNLTDSGVTIPVYENVSTSAYPTQSSFGRIDSAVLTLTGCTTSPTGTAYFIQQGNTVEIIFPDILGTSNSTSCTLTGVPAKYQTTNFIFMQAIVEDNSTDYVQQILLSAGSGTITLYKGAAAGFTSSGSKGIRRCSVKYRLGF